MLSVFFAHSNWWIKPIFQGFGEGLGKVLGRFGDGFGKVWGGIKYDVAGSSVKNFKLYTRADRDLATVVELNVEMIEMNLCIH